MIVEEQQMTEQVNVSEIVEEIFVAFSALEERRKYMFLDWLFHHIDAVDSAHALRAGLTAWFSALSPEDMRWEHKIISREIEWWHFLDEITLARLIVERVARGES
jgi:hypothetical protein